jgi:hypothetical protein
LSPTDKLRQFKQGVSVFFHLFGPYKINN